MISLVLVLGLATQRPAPPLDIVEVVGCLSDAANVTWVLTNATDPMVSKTPSTTVAAVAQALARPLGTRSYRLIGVTPFAPASHKGQKVVVKGVLIKDARESRINVTSLQSADETCKQPPS
jgi:hypothetical protein